MKTIETERENELTLREPRLFESTMANHPGLTAAEAIEALRNAGM